VQRTWVTIVAVVFVVMIAGVGLVRLVVGRSVGNALYPPAPSMPAAVPETAEKLLARYEQLLRDRAAHVLAAMNPGLTDAQIDALQTKGRFVLPPDLRALYRWRDGTPRASNVQAFADHRFVSLEDALADRDALRAGLESNGFIARQVFSTVVGHRKAWLEVIVDVAGDGYFFDPGRSEAEGSFFFCFTEDSTYVFYPAFRNFLAATIKGHETGIFKFGKEGAETVDFERAMKLWNQYGASNIQ
jgi:cell wall assembly regulator SMI1